MVLHTDTRARIISIHDITTIVALDQFVITLWLGILIDPSTKIIHIIIYRRWSKRAWIHTGMQSNPVYARCVCLLIPLCGTLLYEKRGRCDRREEYHGYICWYSRILQTLSWPTGFIRALWNNLTASNSISNHWDVLHIALHVCRPIGHTYKLESSIILHK